MCKEDSKIGWKVRIINLEGVGMCEFCLKHGEGKKWYLQAKNYSDDLLSDVRRRRFIEEFASAPEALARDAQRMDRLKKAPRFIRSIITHIITRRMKKIHFGQVVPIEEIEQIFGFANSIVRVACICRSVCKKNAIRLEERIKVPVGANLW
jgi:hypothetical protein